MSGINWLLVSDVDHTLLGDDDATRRFAEFYRTRHPGLRVCYASGRFYDSLLESVETTPLPMPDFIIGGVGTQIYDAVRDERIHEWEQNINVSWDPEKVRDALKGVEGLETQPEKFQSPFKVSYYYYNASTEDIDKLKRRVKEASIDAQVIYSSNRDLDFLPAKADKGAAAAFLAHFIGIDKNHVLASGDSGNDLTLFQQEFKGIVVANAHPELKALDHERAYHASRPYADGVVEGLKYWMKD